MSGEGDDDDDGNDDGNGNDNGHDAELVYELVVTSAEAGTRLDALIAARIPSLSRAAAQRLIDGGQVTLAGHVTTKAGARIRSRDHVQLRVPPPTVLEVMAEDIPLVILHEDAELIVIDKPAGLVVHPAQGHASGTLVNALLFHCTDLSGIGGVLRPGIVHRLDKDTSGVMVATKSDRAHAALTAAFAAKSKGKTVAGEGIERTYLAIAAPPPPANRGTLRTLYGRHPVQRKKFSSRVGSGKAAVTHYEVIEPLVGAAVVRLRLETGRTHQIRVHASDHGWPLLGDPVYAPPLTEPRLVAAAAALGRQALHASTLAFDHPTTGVRLSFEATLPPELVAARDTLR